MLASGSEPFILRLSPDPLVPQQRLRRRGPKHQSDREPSPRTKYQIGLRLMSAVNIFNSYKQEENHFTNSLISVLSMSRHDNPEFLMSFLRDTLGPIPNGAVATFRVLRGIEGTADGELSGEDCCIRLETKIASGTLRAEQIRDHLKHLYARPESLKRLVLLTPDDNHSRYLQQFISPENLKRLVLLTPDDGHNKSLQQFVSLEPNCVVHRGWMSVYKVFEDSIGGTTSGVFAELVRQFLNRIRDNVFNQDMAGIIMKIDFGDKSTVYVDRYLDEFATGIWTVWNTPREYKQLDGTGRKMLFYDRERQGITAEVEIQKVTRTDSEPDYPWSNEFAPGTVRIFDQPIPVSRIRSIQGFEGFGLYKKDRSAYRNITREQYRELTNDQFVSGIGIEADPFPCISADSNQFTLRERLWYAAEFIGEEFGDQIRSYSPIRVSEVAGADSGMRQFSLSFYHANYPEGVRDKQYSLQTIERTATFLLARSTEHTPARLLLIHAMSWDWLTQHGGVERPHEFLDVQDWLSAHA